MQFTSQGPRGEQVHQFEKVAILKYVVKLVIKTIIFSPVATQPALTWQAVCTQIVSRGLNSYHANMKTLRSPSTELWNILAVYSMMCPYDLDLFSQKNWVTDPEGALNVCAYLEVCIRFRF